MCGPPQIHTKSDYKTNPSKQAKEFCRYMNNTYQHYKKVPEYVVKCKPKTDEEIKEYHRKRLYELSLKSLGEVPQLEDPDYDQKAWIIRKMKRSFT